MMKIDPLKLKAFDYSKIKEMERNPNDVINSKILLLQSLITESNNNTRKYQEIINTYIYRFNELGFDYTQLDKPQNEQNKPNNEEKKEGEENKENNENKNGGENNSCINENKQIEKKSSVKSENIIDEKINMTKEKKYVNIFKENIDIKKRSSIPKVKEFFLDDKNKSNERLKKSYTNTKKSDKEKKKRKI